MENKLRITAETASVDLCDHFPKVFPRMGFPEGFLVIVRDLFNCHTLECAEMRIKTQFLQP